MKDLLRNLSIMILLAFIVISKEECANDEIYIDALQTECMKIEDFLEKESPEKNINLGYLASKGIIEKRDFILEIYELNDEKLQSHNKAKSKLYIPTYCLEAMKKDENIKLDKDNAIIVLAINNGNKNDNNLPEIFFIIRQNNPNSNKKYINSKNFDFSLCHKDQILLDLEVGIEDLQYADETPINIDKILFAKKSKIDLFDPHSEFLDDICFRFTSENKRDVTLESRVEDYYQNITLCNEKEGSHYMGFNYSTENEKIEYRCSFGFYESEEQKESYIEDIDAKVKFLFSSSNIKVITCYELLLNIKDFFHNYGGLICFFVLVAQAILHINFCCTGIIPLEKKVEDLFKSAQPKKAEPDQSTEKPNDGNLDSGEKTDGRLKTNIEENNNERIIINNIETENKEEKNENGNENQMPVEVIKEENKENEVNINRNKKKKKTKKSIKANPPKSKLQRRETAPAIPLKNPLKLENKEGEGDGEAKIIRQNTRHKSTNKKKRTLKRKKSKVIPEIYAINNEEKNDLAFEDLEENDKRNLCQYYGSLLISGHVIVNLFNFVDYNLLSIKIGLLLMLFPINLTFNIFFFTSKNIKSTYIRDLNDLSIVVNNLLHSFLSSIFSSIILISLKFLCLTHNTIKSLRSISDVEEAKKKTTWMFRCIKLRLLIYYLLCYVFIIIFGYYIACFCAVFENTQLDLIKSMFTSWALSLFYPFIIYFINSIIRMLAIKLKSKCLYTINFILQFL